MMDCYTERAHLLALLTRHYPTVIYEPNDAEVGFSYALWLDIDGVPCTWHIADADLWLFDRYGFADGVTWEGQTTTDKYAHIAAAVDGTAIAIDRYETDGADE